MKLHLDCQCRIYLLPRPFTDLLVRFVEFAARCNGVPIGPQAAVGWIYVYPDGMRKQLDWIRTRYGNPVVYITENGELQKLAFISHTHHTLLMTLIFSDKGLGRCVCSSVQ